MSHRPLHYLGTNGILEIQAATAGWLSMHGNAWNLFDCSPLSADGSRRGGGGTIIPGVSGTDADPSRVTMSAHSLPFVVTGEVDPTGAIPGDGSIAAREAQFDTTLAYLKAQITAEASSTDGTRPARLTLRNGSVLHADIHCLAFTFVQNLATGYSRMFTFDLDIPNGVFV